MEYVSDIYLLSTKFLYDYPHNKYPELMYKQNRPYAFLLIDVFEDFYICIPYRSYITHNNAYLFKKSIRSKINKSGLDYSKVVLINKDEYIDKKKVIIDQDEYKETMQNIDKIAKEITNYIYTYKQHILGIKTINTKQFQRKYKYSTLIYFHDILNIKTNRISG